MAALYTLAAERLGLPEVFTVAACGHAKSAAREEVSSHGASGWLAWPLHHNTGCCKAPNQRSAC